MDEKMGKTFVKLGIGMQPTEELPDSPGVQGFIAKIEAYFSSLKPKDSVLVRAFCFLPSH